MNIKYKIKLILKPGKASPTPPISPILGQYGINIMEFCKKFNNLTEKNNCEFVYVKIIIFDDLKYEILVFSDSLVNNIKKKINIKKFSKKPGIENILFKNFEIIDIISKERIFLEKKKEFSIKKMILGTMISLGINYE